MHSIVGLIKTSSAMTIPNDFPDGPVLLGQRTLQMAPANEKCTHAETAEGTHIKKGGCPRRLPLGAWFQMLYATFGSFVPLAMLCYGCQQNFAKASTEFACKYYMMDELKLDGVTIGRFMTAAHVPWNIKPVLGMLSDSVTFCGFHRTSYVAAMCCLSITMYSWVGFSAVSALGLLAFLTVNNFATAFTDVLVDATTARLARCHASQACDLQTAIRVSQAAGGLASSAIKGTLVSVLSPRGTIMSNILCVVVVLVPALRGWLPEERLPGKCCTASLKTCSQNSGLTLAAAFLTFLAVTLFVSQTFLPGWRTRAAVLIVCSVSVVGCAYKVFSKISPYLWKTSALLFLRACFQPGLGGSMFVWMSKDPNGPRFTPELLGLADCFGHAGLLVGVVIFNKFLRSWKYRNIFLLGQLLVILLQFMDLIRVLRWNLHMGLPDIVFFIGDETFDTAVERTFYVPLVVLAYKVCPGHLEATIFATLIATSNIGVDCGKYLGVALAEVWGIVGEDFQYLPHGIISKALFRLVPIPFILMLSPDFTPDDPIPTSDPIPSSDEDLTKRKEANNEQRRELQEL